MIKCSRCRARNSDTSEICSACGIQFALAALAKRKRRTLIFLGSLAVIFIITLLYIQ